MKRQAEGAASVRKRQGPRQHLAPEFEDLARGDADRPRRTVTRSPKLRDPRPVALIPGVSNREARQVYESFVIRLQSLLPAAAEQPLPATFWRTWEHFWHLRLWRARNWTNDAAFFEEQLQLPWSLVEEHQPKTAKSGAAWSDEAVAIVLRAEAALLESGLRAEIGIQQVDKRERMILDVQVEQAPEAFDAIARRLRPLMQDGFRQPSAPRSQRPAR